MSYERCAEHNLMRCIICSFKEKNPVVPKPIPATLTVNPEYLLDDGAKPPTAVTDAAPAPDAQAHEAMERQTQILAARGELDAPVQTVEVALNDTKSEYPATISDLIVDERARSESPIVIAAQEFASAEKHLALSERRVEVAKKEQENAIIERDKAFAKRDKLKANLQKLLV